MCLLHCFGGVFTFSCSLDRFSISLMEVQGVHLISSRVMLKGTSLLNFGMFQGMIATETVVHFFIHKLMVHLSHYQHTILAFSF